MVVVSSLSTLCFCLEMTSGKLTTRWERRWLPRWGVKGARDEPGPWQILGSSWEENDGRSSPERLLQQFPLRVYGQNKIKSGTKFPESSQVLPSQNVFSESHRGSFVSTPFRVCKHGDLGGVKNPPWAMEQERTKLISPVRLLAPAPVLPSLSWAREWRNRTGENASSGGQLCWRWTLTLQPSGIEQEGKVVGPLSLLVNKQYFPTLTGSDASCFHIPVEWDWNSLTWHLKPWRWPCSTSAACSRLGLTHETTL